MRPTTSIILAVIFVQISTCDAANILVTVVGVSASQNLIMYRLADIMGQRGHNVTIVNARFFPEAKVVPLKYAKEISYNIVPATEDVDAIRSMMADFTWTASEDEPMDHTKMVTVFRNIRLGCERLLKEKTLIETLKQSNFDAVVIHMLDFCTFGLTRVLNIDAYIWMSTAMMIEPMAWYSGSPLAQSYVPNMPPVSKLPMSFLERSKNLFVSTAILGAFQYGIVGPYTELFRQHYGQEFPNFDEIFRRTQLYFVNADSLFEYARPKTDNVIYVGGLTMKKPEPLSKEWQKVVDEAPKEGIVVFALGSVANTTFMPQELRMTFLNAFKRLPHLVIWRFEGDFPEAKGVKNVLLANWLPQKDLLANPKVKAFITHGGYNSLTEAAYVGVPLLLMPLFGDQYGNTVRALRLNIGAKLSRIGLTEQKVYDALTTVLYNETIQENARRLGQMIQRKPFSSYDEAVGWLEFLAEFKRVDQLQPLSHAIPLYQYLMLDILTIMLVALTVVVVLLLTCAKCCCRLCCGKRTTGKTKAE